MKNVLKERAERLLADIDAGFEKGVTDEAAVRIIITAFLEVIDQQTHPSKN